MIEKKEVMPIPFLKKEPFTGSYKGMRYKLEKFETEDDGQSKTVLRVWSYPQPFCFDMTPEEQKTSHLFDFSDDGIQAAIDWLNTFYKENY